MSDWVIAFSERFRYADDEEGTTLEGIIIYYDKECFGHRR